MRNSLLAAPAHGGRALCPQGSGDAFGLLGLDPDCKADVAQWGAGAIADPLAGLALAGYSSEGQPCQGGHQIHWMNAPSASGLLICSHFWLEEVEVLFQMGDSPSERGMQRGVTHRKQFPVAYPRRRQEPHSPGEGGRGLHESSLVDETWETQTTSLKMGDQAVSQICQTFCLSSYVCTLLPLPQPCPADLSPCLWSLPVLYSLASFLPLQIPRSPTPTLHSLIPETGAS